MGNDNYRKEDEMYSESKIEKFFDAIERHPMLVALFIVLPFFGPSTGDGTSFREYPKKVRVWVIIYLVLALLIFLLLIFAGLYMFFE